MTAAALKTHQLWSEPVAERTLFSPRGVTFGLIELELVLGLCFLTNLWPVAVRAIGFLLFTAFAGVALSKVIAGARSCGCTGDIEILPHAAVLADFCVLVALYHWRPVGSHRFHRSLLGLLFLIAVPFPIAAAFRPMPYPQLTVAPVIDLGQLPASQKNCFPLVLRNPHDEAVEILAIESSCPCVEGAALPHTVAAGAEEAIFLVLNPSARPGPGGPLSLEIAGRTGGEVIAFVTQGMRTCCLAQEVDREP